MNQVQKPIGKVITTSTSENLIIRLKRKVSIEKLQLGGYVTIQGAMFLYIGKIVDIHSREVTKGTTDIQMQMEDINELGMNIGKLPLNLLGGIAYDITVKPLRVIPLDREKSAIEPKTAPPVFAVALPTYATEIVQLYTQDESKYIEIGILGGIMGPDVPVKINIDKLMTLHGGIFAKTGSGKTMLAKIIMGHVTARENKSALIFDMHNEYGYKPDGLKPYFDSKIIVVGLKQKGKMLKIDETMEIPRSQVTMRDVLMAVDLTEAQERALYVLEDKFGRYEWFDKLMETEVSELLEELGSVGSIHEATLSIAKTNVKRFFDSLPFIVKSDAAREKNTADNILSWLQQGRSVIVSFGAFSKDPTVYAVATNMIARRLLELYRSKFDEDTADTLPQVIIMLEEAHKFLNRNHLNSTFFGTFVREARKFNLGLLIVDQSPSQIHEEVMAQLGTQFIMQLGNEKDKKMVINQSEENLREYSREITSLNPREGLVAGKSSDFLQSFNVTEYIPVNLKRIWGLDQSSNKGEKKLPKRPLGGIQT